MLLVLREELICFVILAFLAFYYSNNKIKEKGQNFYNILNASIAYVAFDMITVITVNNQEIIPAYINDISHYIFYILGICVGICFYFYAIRICAIYEYEKVLKIIGWIPVPIYIITLFFIPVEYVTGKNINYSTGLLAYITFAVFLEYCVLGTSFMLVFRKRIDEGVKNAIFPMIIPLCISIIAQAFFPELLMTGGSATLMCLSIFVGLDSPDKKYKKLALWDFLTGLRNRNSYDRDKIMYETRVKNRKNKNKIGVLVADLNNLKKINDNYGHQDGDIFISTAANILKNNLKSAEAIYRIGGDEFIAFFLKPDDERIKLEIENIRSDYQKINNFPFPLEIAMGYHSDIIIETIDEIINIADKKMYENKKAIKEK